MKREKPSPFNITRHDNVVRLERVCHQTRESVSETGRPATTVTSSSPVLTKPPAHSSSPNLGLNFNPDVLKEALNDLYRLTQELRLALVDQYSGADDARGEDIREVLALKQQQIDCGRRDHARNERMLGVYQNIRGRLVAACSGHGSSAQSIEARLDVNVDRQLAETLGPLMHLAAAYNPDDSDYSKHWRKVLLAHVMDLRLIVWCVLEGHPLESPHYHRHPSANGRFTMPPGRTQANVLRELRRDLGYTILKHKGPIAVCCSSIAKQIILVAPDGARRDIAVLPLMNDSTELTNAEESGTVGFEIRRLLRMSGHTLIGID